MNGIVILGCGASFRSGSPHIFSAALLHLTLIVSLTCDSCPLTLQREDRHQETRGPLFLTTGSTRTLPPSSSSCQLDLSYMYSQRKTQIQSIRPAGAAEAPIVVALLKVCHIFLIIFPTIPVRGCSHVNLCIENVSVAFSSENHC